MRSACTRPPTRRDGARSAAPRPAPRRAARGGTRAKHAGPLAWRGGASGLSAVGRTAERPRGRLAGCPVAAGGAAGKAPVCAARDGLVEPSTELTPHEYASAGKDLCPRTGGAALARTRPPPAHETGSEHFRRTSPARAGRPAAARAPRAPLLAVRAAGGAGPPAPPAGRHQYTAGACVAPCEPTRRRPEKKRGCALQSYNRYNLYHCPCPAPTHAPNAGRPRGRGLGRGRPRSANRARAAGRAGPRPRASRRAPARRWAPPANGGGAARSITRRRKGKGFTIPVAGCSRLQAGFAIAFQASHTRRSLLISSRLLAAAPAALPAPAAAATAP